MVGYPYFYETHNLKQEKIENSMTFSIFSLDPISEDWELNLAHASSLSIIIDPLIPPQFELGDEFSYKFYDQIS